jgi:hypothetical protein
MRACFGRWNGKGMHDIIRSEGCISLPLVVGSTTNRGSGRPRGLARVGFLEDHRVSVGTGGSVERMRGPWACPDREAIQVSNVIPANRQGSQDKHKAPSQRLISPLSLQNRHLAIAGWQDRFFGEYPPRL